MRRLRASWRLAAAAPSSIPDLYIQPQAREEAPMELYRFRQGSLPLLVSMPHCGTHVPPAITGRLTEIAQRDRKSGVSGKGVSVRVDLGGRRIIIKKKYTSNIDSL